MSSLIGKTLGSYRIVAPLGAGGMGEACRARDSRLDRDVVVKVLPTHLSRCASVRCHPEIVGLCLFRITLHVPLSGIEPVIGGLRDIDSRRQMHELRTNTRAKKKVILTYAEENASGKRMLPAQFIEEIDEAFRESVQIALSESAHVEHLHRQFSPKQNVHVRVDEKEYLNQLFLDQGFAVTHLNNFLECPWRYFFDNLIRIQRARSRHQYYGIAIHAALRHFFDALREGAAPSKEALLVFYGREIASVPLEDKVQEEFLQKGMLALGGYYTKYHKFFKVPLWNEKNIAGVFVDVPRTDGNTVRLMLRGTIDKTELVDSQNVHVIDYKTGKPKSRNVIEGKTKSSIGKEHRQLAFYKLLVDSYEPEKFTVVSGEVDFVEPDKKGEYHREKFLLSDEDVESLKEEIRTAATKILDLSFFAERCGKRDCSYCELADMMQERTL